MKSIKMVPISDYVSLKMEVDRLTDLVEDLTFKLTSASQAAGNVLDKGIIVSSRGLSQFVKLSDIVMIKADSNYSSIYLTNGQCLFTSKTLKYWENKCGTSCMYRVHKSYIVNSRMINTFEPKTGKLEMAGGLEAFYSEQGKRILMEMRK